MIIRVWPVVAGSAYLSGTMTMAGFCSTPDLREFEGLR